MHPSRAVRLFVVAGVFSTLATGLLLLNPTQAQTAKGKKYALLVGVRSYDHSKLADLKHTENDVEQLGKLLGKSHFTEIVVLTTTRGERREADKPTAANIRTQLKRLLKRVTKHDTMLVALSGHGLQFELVVDGKKKDESFFCPADARPRKTKDLADLSETMLGFTELFGQLDESGVGVKLLLVDACRSEPEGFRSSDVDTVPRPSKGTAALFSCKSGERSFELAKLKHGIFFHYVLKGLRGEARNEDGEVTWDDLSRYVRRQVSRESPKLISSGGRQTPHGISNLEGDSPVLVGPGKSTVVNSIGMKLVRIPAGKFMMGSTKEEQDETIADYEKSTGKKASDVVVDFFRTEGPRHEVELTKDFYLGIHEVTQAQYRKVTGKSPSWFSATGGGKDNVKDLSTDDFPVEMVSYEDAIAFCRKLSGMPAEKRAGRKYRLPTEAEWEYSCRGGPTSSSQVFHFGNSLSSSQANFNGNAPYGDAGKGPFLNRTCKVGQYTANQFGLHDMHGNVAEWCSDWYGAGYYGKRDRHDPPGPSEGSYRVFRGGSWVNFAWYCRSAHRDRNEPTYRDQGRGFRVAVAASRHGVD